MHFGLIAALTLLGTSSAEEACDGAAHPIKEAGGYMHAFDKYTLT